MEPWYAQGTRRTRQRNEAGSSYALVSPTKSWISTTAQHYLPPKSTRSRSVHPKTRQRQVAITYVNLVSGGGASNNSEKVNQTIREGEPTKGHAVVHNPYHTTNSVPFFSIHELSGASVLLFEGVMTEERQSIIYRTSRRARSAVFFLSFSLSSTPTSPFSTFSFPLDRLSNHSHHEAMIWCERLILSII